MTESWTQTMAFLEKEVPSHTFHTWIKPLHYRSTQGNQIVIEVPNCFFKDRLQGQHATLIRDKLREFSQNDSIEINFVIADHLAQNPSFLKSISLTQNQILKKAGETPCTDLSDKFTFDSFVVGTGNQLAHAAAQAVSSAPGLIYNPLFIYGGVGLGKTHLLSAIGNQILLKRPQTRILYRTSEQFTNDLINAIRYEKTEDFRARYRRSCDVLLLDDIQFLAGKERTQEEFFHTFNELHQGNKQIVLSSDQMAKDIPDLDERLRSRFQWGLLCDIQPPDVETRIAILKKKAERDSVLLPDDVAQFLARQFKSNIRVLEGALIRVAAYASLSRREIDLTFAQEVLETLNPSAGAISTETILKRVSEFFNLNVSDLKSARRHKVVALPRQIAMYLARKLTSASFPEIGASFGGKDHTTVIHGVQKIERMLEKDPRLKQTLSAIEKSIAA